VRYLINSARSLIFSTAPPPPAVAGALAALELLQERPYRVERLRANARVLRRALAHEGFAPAESDMHIVPLIVGEEREAMRLCQRALERGVFAQAIRPPTVPAGTSRLRLTAMASHTASDLQMAARILGEAAAELGLDLGRMTPPEAEPTTLREPALPEHDFAAIDAPGPFDFEREAEAPTCAGGGSVFDFEQDLQGVRAA
jgi:glycine C-acetyltransferase/8-amino-7-oxononanoate synthase